ncbi:MAG: hypothetical protein QW215_00075 [Ignisphaera sp.]
MSNELLELAEKYEMELEQIEKEKKAIVIDFVELYHNPNVEWNSLLMLKIFDLMVQALFPNDIVERYDLASDTPMDKYPFELKKIIESLKNCKNVIVVKEYDTLYYCVQ